MSATAGAYPDLLPLAARLARHHRLDTVIGIGQMTWLEAAARHPELEFVEVATGARRSEAGKPWSPRCIDWDPTSGARPPIDRSDLSRSVVVCTILDDEASKLDGFEMLRTLLEVVPVGVVASARFGQSPTESLGATLAGARLPPLFAGWTRRFAAHDAQLAIVDRIIPGDASAPPSDFRVVALMTAYNEADVIGPSIEALVARGIEVYLIDNWSSDRTCEIAEAFRGRGLIGLERYPEAPTSIYDWAALLRRVETVAASLPATWFIHHDADERRLSPWPDRSLREAMWTVHQSGFNAIDHTVLDFRPIDDGFVPGSDYEAYFKHFEFGTRPDLLVQIKAWKNTGAQVRLAESGGHEAAFAGQRVFPYKFLLKHYPIRSQSHGERKILVERRARWNPAERARGWHLQYDNVESGHGFVRRPEELVEFIPGRTDKDYLVPLISGIGLAPFTAPAWAVRSRAGWLTHRWASHLVHRPETRRIRASRLMRLPMVRRIARWLVRPLLGDGL